MPLWGSNDAASNSTIYAAAQLKQTPNTANRTALFGNSTADAYFTGVTVGQYGVDSNETASNPAITHTGWNLRTEGSGGRAGRVFYETLVAGGIGTDASDDTVLPDAVLTILTDPSNVSGNATANQSVTFTTSVSVVPPTATPTYLWYFSVVNATSGFVTTVGNTAFTNQTTATLTANSKTLNTNTWVRTVVSATGGVSVNTAVAKLTVTT